VAVALRFRGYEVTIVEMLDHILPLGFDKKGALKVKGFLEENGIEVRVNERATGIQGGTRVEGLATEKGGIPCDTLVWAIGMHPRTELVRDAGIALGETGGILVDSHMETSIPGIYACGDCVESADMLTGLPGLSLFWHNANRQGAVAGDNCVGVPRHYAGSQNLLNVDVFGNHVVAFGHTEEMLREREGPSAQPGIIDEEREGGYFRLVVQGDRCMGAQFINMEKDLGLVWSIMSKRESIAGLHRALADDGMMGRRKWLYRIQPFFPSC
jgi:NADH oxidase (H2O2-forming)